MSGIDYGILILTHGRPDRQITIRTLERQGYTGRWWLIVDDEDETAEDLRVRYGADRVVSFNRDEVAGLFDEGFNFRAGERSGVVYARAAAWEIAERLGLRYFIQLDDDYLGFHYRFDGELRASSKTPPIRSLDQTFSSLVTFFDGLPPQIVTVAIAQGGDYVGGVLRSYHARSIKVRRKAMNLFVCDTARPFTFPGRLNEDVNAYTQEQRAGQAMLTVMQVSLEQVPTQAGAGGMVEIYLDQGTYVKSMYSVIRCPSAVICTSLRGATYHRLHHEVNYRHCAPRILHERHRRVPA